MAIYLQAMAKQRKRKASTCTATVQMRISAGKSAQLALSKNSQENDAPGMYVTSIAPNPFAIVPSSAEAPCLFLWEAFPCDIRFLRVDRR